MALKLTEIEDLRRLTIHPIFHTSSDVPFEFLSVLTIASTTFCELVLVLGRYSFCPDRMRWNRWAEIDRFLYGRFAEHGDFRLVVKAGNLGVLDSFRRGAHEGFPLLASRGCVHFEICCSIDKYWR